MSNSSHTTSPVEAGETRRSFIRKTATLAAAASVANILKTPVYGQAQSPSANVTGANNRLVLGLVGCGKQGNTHIKLIQPAAAVNNVKIGAVCDLYQKHLDAAKTSVGLSDADAYRDHRKLLERKDIDAIIIATVDNWHAPASIDGLEAGKHVYCEKPMTRYVAEGWAVLDTVKRTGKVYQCGSQYTADPVVHKSAEWIKEGKLGPLVWAQSSYCRNNKNNSEWTFPVDPDATPENLDWNRWLGQATKIPWDPERYFSWHKYYDYNSGIIGNLLSHRFYALMLATGDPQYPRRVCCTGTRKVSTDREITDTTHVVVEFPNGLTFVIVGSTVNQIGLPDIIRGRMATLYLSGSQNEMQLTPEKIFADEIDAETFKDPTPFGKIERLQKNFYDCIRNGGTPYCNAELSDRANTVLCLAEMSERLGMTLFFDPATRTIKSGDGRVMPPMTYDTVVPAPPVG
ncbi:MAG TPA: Gfo/Idh/MocA family oxidoreductase [Verrucomicrobiota bacterium]|nr:Gfo/Idh/MocA family oxidoreductase [Verrucomicrobiota bacterium]